MILNQTNNLMNLTIMTTWIMMASYRLMELKQMVSWL
nr:MAG TPA: hypothetical protein [Caudoviricetes sp.]